MSSETVSFWSGAAAITFTILAAFAGLIAWHFSNKVADDRKFELDTIKAKLSWRTLTKPQQRAVAQKMSVWAKLPEGDTRQSVAVFSTNGLFESTQLADQISEALGPNGAGFTIYRYPVTYGISVSVSGVALLTSSHPRGLKVANALVEALVEQNINASIAPQRAPGCENMRDFEDRKDTDPACSAISIMVGDHP